MTPASILHFWFDELTPTQHFAKDAQLDAAIGQRFGVLLEAGARGELLGWRVNAANSSGAYGIPQALPGSKMASAGADWQTNPATQIAWGLGYIAGRYGTPCGAWDHSESNGWY